MQPPTKDQSDIGQDNPTLDASNSPDNIDRARQEFKNEADINYMLSRFGITPARGAPTYGEWDDTVDLQTALQSVSDAQLAFRRLPPELQAKFPRMEDILTALNNGSLVIKDDEPPAQPVSPPIPSA